MLFLMKYRQSGELQHQLLGAGGVELDSGFLVGSGAVDGEDRALAELLVPHTHALLDEVGVRGFERLSRGAGSGL